MKKIVSSLLVSFLPVVARAQGPSFSWTESLIRRISNFVDLLIPIVGGLALLYFFWGLASFISKSGDEKAKVEGKLKMTWGIITLFVMFSIWGIIRVIGGELGINPLQNSPAIPTISGSFSGGGGASDPDPLEGTDPFGDEPCPEFGVAPDC